MRYLSLSFIVLLFVSLAWGLPPAKVNRAHQDKPRKQSKDRIYLLHSDRLYFDETQHRTAKFLVGNVRFSHSGVILTCDSALFYENNNSFDAFGNVHMVQGDTVSLKSEILYYNGLDQLARARHNCILKHGKTVLYTDSLDYDRLYNLGYFFDGGRLLDQDNELTADWGEYNPTTHEAIFNYNVKLLNPAPPKKAQTTLLTDTLHYNTQTTNSHFVGPSTIDDGSMHIYSENGYYDTKSRNSYFLDRSELNNGFKQLIGDSVCWNNVDSVGEAFGNVLYVDKEGKNSMTGNYLYYDDKKGYSLGTDSACLIDYSQPDTLYIHGDSIKMYSFNIRTDSAYRDIYCYYHVRSYKKDMQGVCDSLVYHGKDSVMIMYRDPIVWQANQQILGEEIRVFLNDSTMDSVQVLRQTLSVERLDSIHYNQVAGHEIHTYFRNGDVYLTHVIGNVIVNYHPLDEDNYMIGMNHLESSEMKMYMDSLQKLDYIWVPANTGTMYPLSKISQKDAFLENFHWFDYIRPVDKNDLFEWRPKNSEAELKPSKQRQAPIQKLKDIKKSN